MSGRFPALVVLLLGTSLTPLGCETSCGDGDSDPVLWVDGSSTTADGTLTYESTPMNGTWLHFPSGRRFRLVHDLGTANLSIQAYLSFRPQPLGSDPSERGSFVMVSGNVALVSNVTEESLMVENNSCENDYYLFVRAVGHDTSTAE
jgi:hypothetical protein